MTEINNKTKREGHYLQKQVCSIIFFALGYLSITKSVEEDHISCHYSWPDNDNNYHNIWLSADEGCGDGT